MDDELTITHNPSGGDMMLCHRCGVVSNWGFLHASDCPLTHPPEPPPGAAPGERGADQEG